MKYLKLVVMAAIAAMTLTGLAPGTASATVGCKTTTTPCTDKYPAGTEAHVQLVTGTKAIVNAVWTDVECGSTTGKGTLTKAGSATETVSGPIETWTAGECKCAGSAAGSAHVTFLQTGSLEGHHISGTENGTVTGFNQTITVNCTPLGTQCIFGTKGEGTHLGVMTGGTNPTIHGAATINHFAGTNDEGTFLCGSTAKWEAQYEVTSPKPVYVEPS